MFSSRSCLCPAGVAAYEALGRGRPGLPESPVELCDRGSIGPERRSS